MKSAEKHVVTKRADLLAALASIATISKPQTIIPILKNAKIEAEEGAEAMRVTGTNLDVTIVSAVPAEIMAPMAFTASASDLLNALKACDADDVALAHERGRLVMVCGSASFEIVTLSADDYPVSRDMPRGGVTLRLADLHAAVAATGHATCEEETRAQFGGIQMECERGRVSFVATDGSRLALFECDCELKAKFSALIPHAALKAIPKLAGERVTISADDDVVALVADQAIITRKLEGQFPAKWREVIEPTEALKSCRVNRAALLAAVRRVKQLTGESLKSGLHVRNLAVAFDGPRIEISGQDDTRGSARDVVVADGSESCEMSINASYMELALVALPDGMTELRFGGKSHQLQLQPVDGGTLQVVMPIRS